LGCKGFRVKRFYQLLKGKDTIIKCKFCWFFKVNFVFVQIIVKCRLNYFYVGLYGHKKCGLKKYGSDLGSSWNVGFCLIASKLISCFVAFIYLTILIVVFHIFFCLRHDKFFLVTFKFNYLLKSGNHSQQF